jgi:hypothetical protein
MSVGVVFVHGIGSQKQSEALRGFARPLVAWLERWYRDRGSSLETLVTSSHLSYGEPGPHPAYVTITLPATTDEQGAHPAATWVIAEAWWADRVDPPGFGDMLLWALRSLWRAVTHLGGEAFDKAVLALVQIFGRPIRGRHPARSDPGALGALVEFGSSLILTIAYGGGLLIGYIVLIPLFALVQLPFPTWQKTIFARLEPFLVNSLGDFRQYVADPVQSLHIRRSVEEAVDFLAGRKGCESVCIVAHSHGAVVAFDALVGGAAAKTDHVRKLITVGGALNNVWRLYETTPRLVGTLPKGVFWLDCWSYYDPVPGGQLVRKTAVPLVSPEPPLMAEMHWYEEYVHANNPWPLHTPAHTPPTGPLPRQVTNYLDAVTDHDRYWDNPEQFVSRLAQEIDVPAGYYQRSRFYVDDNAERSRRRRLRVTTLAGWRLIAALAVTVGISLRVAKYGFGRLRQDGEAVTSWAALLPGAQLGDLPGTVFDGVRRVLDGAATAAAGVPQLATWLHTLSTWLGDPGWNSGLHVVIGVVFFAALGIGLHFVLRRLVFDPRDGDEAAASARPVLPPARPLLLLRTLAASTPQLILGWLIAAP